MTWILGRYQKSLSGKRVAPRGAVANLEPESLTAYGLLFFFRHFLLFPFCVID
jgi:hypothetical protein